MVFLTPLTAILHAGSRVSCHSFHILCLRFNKQSNPGRSWLFMSESVTLLVDSLYAEAIEAVKLLAALSASSELIWILGDIKSEARL
jgi:hypothetical protein